jgi:hypothetical protein
VSLAWGPFARSVDAVSETPYTSYGYLEAGVDLATFSLSAQFGRVAPYVDGLSPEEKARAGRLLRENVVVSTTAPVVSTPGSPGYGLRG